MSNWGCGSGEHCADGWLDPIVSFLRRHIPGQDDINEQDRDTAPVHRNPDGF